MLYNQPAWYMRQQLVVKPEPMDCFLSPAISDFSIDKSSQVVVQVDLNRDLNVVGFWAVRRTQGALQGGFCSNPILLDELMLENFPVNEYKHKIFHIRRFILSNFFSQIAFFINIYINTYR